MAQDTSERTRARDGRLLSTVILANGFASIFSALCIWVLLAPDTTLLSHWVIRVVGGLPPALNFIVMVIHGRSMRRARADRG